MKRTKSLYAFAMAVIFAVMCIIFTACNSSGNSSSDTSGSGTVMDPSEKLVVSVEVTKGPDHTNYMIGDRLDPTGMEVTATYEDGRTETVTNYTVDYTNGRGFGLGDTSFTVSVDGQTSAEVTIPSVQGRIVIDPVCCTIAPEVISNMKAQGLDVNTDDGRITIIYSALSDDIILPSAEQMTAPTGDEEEFINWLIGGAPAAKISKDIKENITAVAKLGVRQTFAINNVSLVDNHGTSLLIVNGLSQANQIIELYLAGTNLGLNYLADSAEVMDGGEFTLAVDLAKMQDEWKYQWVDLKIVVGGTYFDIDSSNGNIVDMTQSLINGERMYKFEQWENALKIALNDAPQGIDTVTGPITDFTISAATSDGIAAVTFHGTISREALEHCAGKAVRMGAQSEGTGWADHYWYGEIDASGAWSITMPLSAETVGLNCNVYLHFAIVETAESDEVIKDYGDLLCEWCVNTDLDKANSMGEVIGGAIICEDTNNRFYVGKGDWTGMKMFGTVK